MKKPLIALLAIIAILVTIFIFWDPTDDREDLEELDTVSIDSTKVYCKYKITKVTCEVPTQYVVGDIICITCCTTRKKPWPKKVGPNNNCSKKIKFTETQNSCKIEAKRLKQTCDKCIAKETKAVFECPNN